MKQQLLILTAVVGLTTHPALAITRIALVGDSTVATYKSGEKQGWGSQLGGYLDSQKATVSNFAKGGESSKSFYKLSNWKNTLNSGAKYLFIQFGHNDDNLDDYKPWLRKMVEESRKKGMTPILVTPVRRVRFSNGKSENNLAEHAKRMKEVATELSVPVVDLNSSSGAQYNKWGESKTLSYFVKGDRTHTNKEGAKVIAGLVSEEVQRKVPSIASLFKGGSAPAPEPQPEPPSGNYDPKEDSAYSGYKWRPGEGFSLEKYKLPAKPTCIKEVKSTITVNGDFDGKGCLYTFKGSADGKSYKELCFAPQEISEGLPPMFDLKPGATLKNLQIECALDGVHTSRNNVIENVFFRDVEEDAITVGENITIRNSQFWFCNDKCIQMNRANKAKIENNRFYYATSAVLANYGRDIEVRSNSFYKTKRAIRSRTSSSFVITEGNSHDGGDCHIMAQDKGVLEDWGTGSIKNVKNTRCTENGGKITTK
jgi:lysophospholipase L1-like esterase